MEALNEKNINIDELQTDENSAKIPSESASEVRQMVYTPAELSVKVAMDMSSVYDMIKKGLKKDYFLVFKSGRTVRVDRESFDRWYMNGGER